MNIMCLVALGTHWCCLAKNELAIDRNVSCPKVDFHIGCKTTGVWWSYLVAEFDIGGEEENKTCFTTSSSAKGWPLSSCATDFDFLPSLQSYCIPSCLIWCYLGQKQCNSLIEVVDQWTTTGLPVGLIQKSCITCDRMWHVLSLSQARINQELDW